MASQEVSRVSIDKDRAPLYQRASRSVAILALTCSGTACAAAPPAAEALQTSIEIRGDETCQTDTTAALELLEDKAPDHFDTVKTYIDIIDCAPGQSGVYANETPVRYTVSDQTRQAGTVWYASTIVHDAGHAKLYEDYKVEHPADAVPSDIWTGRAAEAACLESQSDALVQLGATKEQIDYVANVLSTEYYDVPLGDRWW